MHQGLVCASSSHLGYRESESWNSQHLWSMRLKLLMATNLHDQEPCSVCHTPNPPQLCANLICSTICSSLLLAQGHKCVLVLGDNSVTGDSAQVRSNVRARIFLILKVIITPNFLHSLPFLLKGDCHSKSLACLIPFYHQIAHPQNWR